MGIYELMVSGDFSAAHFIKGYEGKCNRLHGHNWLVEVIFSTPKKNDLGISFDLTILKNMLNEILSMLDHKELNNLEYFKEKNPTAENIAEFIHDKLKERLPSSLSLKQIRIWEDKNSYVAFCF